MGQGLSNSSTDLPRLLQKEKQQDGQDNAKTRRKIVVNVPGENCFYSYTDKTKEQKLGINHHNQNRFTPNSVCEPEGNSFYFQRQYQNMMDVASISSDDSSSTSTAYPSSSSDSGCYSPLSTGMESRPSSAASRKTYTGERFERHNSNKPSRFLSRTEFHQHLMQPSIRIGKDEELFTLSSCNRKIKEEEDVFQDIDEAISETVEPFRSTCWDDFEEIELLDQTLSTLR